MGNHLIKMVFSSHSPALSNIIGVALFFSSFICLSKAEKSLLRTDDAYTGRRIKENCSDSGKEVQVCTLDGYSPVFVDQCRVFVETHKHDVIECLGSCPCTAERIEAHIKDLEKDGMQDTDRAIEHIKQLSIILNDEKLSLLPYTGNTILANCSDWGKEVQVCTLDGYSPVFKYWCQVFVETHKHDVIECLGSCPCTAERIEAHIKDLEKDGMQDRAIKHIKELSKILEDEKKSKNGKERRKRSISNIQFAKNMLDEHNKYRSRHGVPPLKLDNKMNDYAQKFAEWLAYYDVLQHDPWGHSRYGENLLETYQSPPKAQDAVKLWYDEWPKYPGYFTLQSGHFSQVIWKNSKKLGVGVANKGDKYYVVAIYDPQGNVEGAFAENVPN